MIKTVAIGRKRSDISHEECVKHHREVHAPMATRVLGPRGGGQLKKYVGYYVEEALMLEGGIQIARPYDLGAVEWFEDEFWKNMETWRKTTPEGIEITEDEARFSDRSSGYLMTCQENVIVSPEGDGPGVNVIVLATKRSDLSHEEFVKHHREVHAPMAARTLGPRFKKYVAYYVDECFSLVEGLMPERPYDVVVVMRQDKDFWANLEAFLKTPEGIAISRDEGTFIDRKGMIALVCQEYTYIQ